MNSMTTTYIVGPGETLTSIANKYGVSVTKMILINPQIEDPNTIYVSQKINVPAMTIDNTEPPWMQIALTELGTKEIPGKHHNKRIIEYHQSTTLKATDDETPWCSSFVNWCITQSGLIGTNSAAAKSWLNWPNGRPVTSPKFGDIVVLNRGEPWQGHVAFYTREETKHYYLLGGNQSNEVSIDMYLKERLAGIIRPIY